MELMRKDHLAHFLIGAAISAVVGIPAGFLHPLCAWFGWFLSVGVFYGREQRDQEVWLTKTLGQNLATVEERTDAWIVPLFHRDSQWDFWCPFVSSTVVSAVIYVFWRCFS